MDRENIFTGIKVWPKQKQQQRCVSIYDSSANEVLLTDRKGFKKFKLDCCMDQKCSQEALYSELMLGLVEYFVQGYNCNLIVCSNCGNSTADDLMQGGATEEAKGLLPRMIDQLVTTVKFFQERQFLFKVSYLEINDQDMFDLLSSASKRSPLQIKNNKQTQEHFVSGLELKTVSGFDEIQPLFKIGLSKSSYAFSKNYRSAKSSSTIFTVYLESAQANQTVIRNSTFTITKLAPDIFEAQNNQNRETEFAENQKLSKTLSQTDWKLSKKFIDLSKQAFQNVIRSICLNDENCTKIPFSDSKVTKLLRTALGGDSKTSILGLLDPCPEKISATFKILKTLQQAKQIQTYPSNIRDTIHEKNNLSHKLSEIRNLENKRQRNELELERLESADIDQYIESEKEKLKKNNEINEFINESEMDEQILTQKTLKEQSLRQELKLLRKDIKSSKGFIFNLSKSLQTEGPNHIHGSSERVTTSIDYPTEHNVLIKRKQILVALRKIKEKGFQATNFNDYSSEERQIRKEVYALQMEQEKQRGGYCSAIRELQAQLSLYKKIAEHSLKKDEIEIIRMNSRYDETKREYDIPSFLVKDKKVHSGSFHSPLKNQRKFMVSPRSDSFNSIYSSRGSNQLSRDKLRKEKLANRTFERFRGALSPGNQNEHQTENHEEYNIKKTPSKLISTKSKFKGFNVDKLKVKQKSLEIGSPRIDKAHSPTTSRQYIRNVKSEYELDIDFEKIKRYEEQRKKSKKRKDVLSPYRGIKNAEAHKTPFRF